MMTLRFFSEENFEGHQGTRFCFQIEHGRANMHYDV
jgi:hypothetical protein